MGKGRSDGDVAVVVLVVWAVVEVVFFFCLLCWMLLGEGQWVLGGVKGTGSDGARWWRSEWCLDWDGLEVGGWCLCLGFLFLFRVGLCLQLEVAFLIV